MLDLRPIAHVIGLLVATLGASMVLPMAADLIAGNAHWRVFLLSGAVTMLTGAFLAIATANVGTDRLTIQQTFLLTSLVWLVLPVFGAVPFVLGATEARAVDAFFEAMSGLTTTGSTVFSGLDALPHGLLLWRGLLQWFGGVGIIVVAMVFLPELRVGGMQIFRSEGFDTFGKILPRAGEIASRISSIYLGLTVICALCYAALGMSGFDAMVHAMTTIATGGFANTDMSFGAVGAATEYAAVVFMLAAALPFVRYVQLVQGHPQPLMRDPQIRTFFALVAAVAVLVALGRAASAGPVTEETLRKALFNTTSIVTGTGYASADYMAWGSFPVMVFFFAGLIGGCAGSTACSVKVFRYQLLFATITTQIRRIHAPHGVFQPRYGGRPVAEEVLNSVMSFFVLFTVTLGVLAVVLGMTGLDFVTALSGAATALANIGPGLGEIIGPAGNFAPLNDSAKWLLALAMLVGRLEVVVVFALFTRRFWQG